MEFNGGANWRLVTVRCAHEELRLNPASLMSIVLTSRMFLQTTQFISVADISEEINEFVFVRSTVQVHTVQYQAD